MKKTSLIAGNPLEPTPYNVTGNSEREWLKREGLGNQQPSTLKGEGSTTRRKPYIQVDGNGKPLNRVKR